MRLPYELMGQFIQQLGDVPLKTTDLSRFVLRAADFCFDASICVPVPSGGSNDFINVLVTYAGVLGAFVALVMSVIGAYKIIMSGGDPNQVRDGREQITNALLGFLLVLLATVVVTTIFRGLGVTD